MPPLYLLIKPASSACQLRCEYCFYYDVANHRDIATFEMMKEETLEVLIQKALAYADDFCVFAYQGGEPTLRGLAFFEKAIALQQKYNYKNITIHQMIQTNGMAIDENWARFFKQHNFLVGVSLDGTKETHDLHRQDHQKKPTFMRVMKSIQLLKEHQVEFNILTVLNATTAKHIHQIYNFYKKQNFKYLQFIPCLNSLDPNEPKSPYALTSKQYKSCLDTLYRLWERDLKAGQYVSIRMFDNWLRMLQGHAPESCGMSGVCGKQYVVEGDGAIYPCDFYVLDEFRLGSVMSESFVQMDEARDVMQFIENSYPVAKKCQQCQFFKLCRGGCRRNREVEIGNLGLNEYCEAYYAFFETHVKSMIEISRVIR